jgi:hypothetical protein
MMPRARKKGKMSSRSRYLEVMRMRPLEGASDFRMRSGIGIFLG